MQVLVCVCVCAPSQVGADRPAGKQAGWSLISPVGADTAAPAGLLQRKHVLYVMLEGSALLCCAVLFMFSCPAVSSLPFSHTHTLSFICDFLLLFQSSLPGVLG